MDESEAEGLKEGVEGGRLIMGIRSGKMGAGKERGKESEKEEQGGKDEGTPRGMQRNGLIVGGGRREMRPHGWLEKSGSALVWLGRVHNVGLGTLAVVSSRP
jgi:hypothetical protein